MKQLFTFTLILLGVSTLSAQQLEELEIKSNGYGEKKLKKAPKKIYVAEFEINYQLMANFSETAQGGRQIGGSYRGDATATLLLGVPGIDENLLQENTDKMYNEYISQLKDAGFEVITPEDAGKTDLYADWTKLTGGTPSQAQNPGYIQTTPTGFSYYKQKIKKGRAKTSAFYYNQIIKLSKQLDNAIVSIVKLNIPVFEDAESGASKSLTKMVGGVAKVVARANYRLTPGIYVQTGSMSGEYVPTQVAFYYSNLAQGVYTIKKDVPITGVFDNEKKYKASQAADVDHWGSDMGAIRVFSPSNLEVKNMQRVECDASKYIQGAELAASGFINGSLALFLEYANP